MGTKLDLYMWTTIAGNFEHWVCALSGLYLDKISRS